MWNWFNGKKTVIGSTLMFVAIFLTEVVVGMWGVSATWIEPAISTLNWFGMILGGTGLVHKTIKAGQ